jgi:glucose/arabinose dehydrogenase
MYIIENRLVTLEIGIISMCCILTYTNSYASGLFDNGTVTDLDEDEEVTLNPILKDSPDLKMEEVSNGLAFPTSMAFLGPDDILVLEKNEGTVKRIVNGVLLERPLLDVDVANDGERGMLGIAITEEKDNAIEEDNNHDDNNHTTYVFLYYTESTGRDGSTAIGNRLYRYELDQDKEELVNPKLLLDLPATPGPTHNGGKIAIGPDDNVYLIIGDVGEHDVSDPSAIINVKDGPEPDGRAGILRVTQDGKPAKGIESAEDEERERLEGGGADDDDNSVLDDEYPENLYYAYGIRNSFGMDFDPATNKLWDVETGSRFGEEVNLVEPGFNSGWVKAQGIWELDDEKRRREGVASPINESFISKLVNFNGKGKYSSPEFTSGKVPITTSGMGFFHSDKLGKQYENDLFVGDFVNGMIFDFDLNEDRTQLSFDDKGPLKDKVADDAQELEEVVFGVGFGGITDIKIGPYDGYLYILSLDRGGDECKDKYPYRACIPYRSTVKGHIFRIISRTT